MYKPSRLTFQPVIVFILFVCLFIFNYQLWFSEQGVRLTSQLNENVQVQTQINNKLEKNNLWLSKEIKQLKKGEALAEEYVREDLGMISQGETFYHLPNT